MNTILLVEDEPNQRLLYRMALEDDGYRVLEAADSEGALAAIREDDPDLVVMDLGLPGPDGCAALDSVVSFAPDLPVIIHSGYDRPVGLKAGWSPADYLVKSSRVDRLRSAIERVLARGDGHADDTMVRIAPSAIPFLKAAGGRSSRIPHL